MASGSKPRVGEKFHDFLRKHPTKPGWMQANGTVVNVLHTDRSDEDALEVVVDFEGNIEIYAFNLIEWESSLGGYWRVV